MRFVPKFGMQVPDGDDAVSAEIGVFLELAVAAEKVHMVDTEQGVQSMRDAIFGSIGERMFTVVGLDAEWKPVWSRGKAERSVEAFHHRLLEFPSLFSSGTLPDRTIAPI